MIMKKLYVIILLISLTGFSSFAQEQDEKTRKNSVSVDYGIMDIMRNNSGSCPNVNAFYRRNVWQGLGLGIGYQYYTCDFFYVGRWTLNTRAPFATICAHNALFRIDYELPISRHFSLLSFCQFGTDWKSYDGGTIEAGEEKYHLFQKDHEFVYSRGFQLEWYYSAFALYFQYEYCLPKIGDIKINHFHRIDEHSLEYRSLGLGLRFKF